MTKFTFKDGNRIWWKIEVCMEKVTEEGISWDVNVFHDDKYLFDGTIVTQDEYIKQNDISHFLNNKFGHITICSIGAAKEI